MLIISPKARISKLADIEDSVRGTRVIIGDDTLVDSFVKIKCVGGTGDVKIGSRCFINSGTVIYSGAGVFIGDNTLIAANCTLAPVNHEYHSREKKISDQGFRPSKGGIVIEEDVWIGANSVILDGAILRKGCVIAAHSLVRSEIEPYSINAGTPSQRIGFR